MYKELDEAFGECRPPWPRQIITPILQYGKYALMNVGPWGKANLKGSRSAPRSGYATTIMIFLFYFFLLIF